MDEGDGAGKLGGVIPPVPFHPPDAVLNLVCSVGTARFVCECYKGIIIIITHNTAYQTCKKQVQNQTDKAIKLSLHLLIDLKQYAAILIQYLELRLVPYKGQVSFSRWGVQSITETSASLNKHRA